MWGWFEQLARYTMRYQESDLHLASILLNLLTLLTPPLFHQLSSISMLVFYSVFVR